MIAENKPGRNDPCPCGSGKKYKRCCMKVVKRNLSQLGFQRAFLKVVKDMGGEIDVSFADLAALDQEEVLAVRHDPVEDVFNFKVHKVKKQTIIQPDKRIIV